MVDIPKDHRLAEIAQHIARRWGVELIEDKNLHKSLAMWMNHFPYQPLHFAHFLINRGEVENELILAHQKGEEFLLFYDGATTASSKRPRELIYAKNPKQVISITWGVPDDTGVLEVFHTPGSFMLEKLSRVRMGHGGGTMVYSSGAPKPQPYAGVSQFYENTYDVEDGYDAFATLKETIDVLLE